MIDASALRSYYAATDLPELDDLDPNRRAFAERAIDRVALTSPLDTEDMIVSEAVRQAIANVAPSREVVQAITEMRLGPAYCYLALYGLDGVARFLKVGMSRHPERRLYSMSTGNPLDCLWVFTAKLPTAKQAYHGEQVLLRHLESRKRRGEWVEIGATDEPGAQALARQLGAVLNDSEPEAGGFLPFGYRDGH